MADDNVSDFRDEGLKSRGRKMLDLTIQIVSRSDDLLMAIINAALLAFKKEVDPDLYWQMVCRLEVEPDAFHQRNATFNSFVQSMNGGSKGLTPYGWIKLDDLSDAETVVIDYFTKTHEILLAVAVGYWPEMEIDLLFPFIGASEFLHRTGFKVFDWSSSTPNEPGSLTQIKLIRKKQIVILEVDFHVLLADHHIQHVTPSKPT